MRLIERVRLVACQNVHCTQKRPLYFGLRTYTRCPTAGAPDFRIVDVADRVWRDTLDERRANLARSAVGYETTQEIALMGVPEPSSMVAVHRGGRADPVWRNFVR